MAYLLEFTAGAARRFRKLPKHVKTRLALPISALVNNPRPASAKKLRGTEGLRLRVGDYRVLYEIEDSASRILIVSVGHRREVYR
ncbi:MAG: type II toxin-antitoxin system RelE/ParE family toxin [Acidobacteria bacterium]|nr:type II toxin-antitoxin system RelE/ParE family toxin [Acidobacteriota bacterium]